MFLYSHWLALDLSTRIKIASIFGIQKSGSTHVVDNQVKVDGFKVEDVEAALNVDALQKYLGSEETDMLVLWDKLKLKIYGLEEPAPTVAPAMSILPPKEAKQFKKEHKERMKKLPKPSQVNKTKNAKPKKNIKSK